MDFIKEGKNALKMKENFKNNKSIKVPEIYQEYNTKRVIVMSYESGIPITDIKQLKQRNVNLRDIGKKLIDCYCKQIFYHGHVHSDPHSGNVFIQIEGDNPKILFLDHGTYINLQEREIVSFAGLWVGLIHQNIRLIKSNCLNLGTGLFKLFSCNCN